MTDSIETMDQAVKTITVKTGKYLTFSLEEEYGMTNRPNHQNGYSKKELIEIIEKIDADQNQIKKQTEKPNTNREGNRSYFTWK
jgi:hypothetical protein